MSKTKEPKFTVKMLHPKYYITWIGVFLMYIISLFPYALLQLIGKFLGWLIFKIIPKRKAIIKRNLELSFPKMKTNDIEKLVNKNQFYSGMYVIEMIMAWFWSDKRIKKIVDIEGIEVLNKLKKSDKGILLVAIHSTNLELGARIYGINCPGVGVYRPNKNIVFDYIQFKGRKRSNKYMLDRKDVKGMLRALKSGDSVWYANDHDYGRHRSIFLPFLGVKKAATMTGGNVLINATKCSLLPFTLSHNSNTSRYTFKYRSVDSDFPYKNVEQGCLFINNIIEESILEAPEQYLWMHRRFKTRPLGEDSLYQDI